MGIKKMSSPLAEEQNDVKSYFLFWDDLIRTLSPGFPKIHCFDLPENFYYKHRLFLIFLSQKHILISFTSILKF